MSDSKDDPPGNDGKGAPTGPQQRPMFQSDASPQQRPPRAFPLLGLILGASALILSFYVYRVYRNSKNRPVPDPAASAVPPEQEGPNLPPGAMVRVEAGTFMMGSTDGDPDERPVTEVKVDAFEIDLTEVTVSAYQVCIEAGKCGLPNITSPTCNWNKLGRDRHPVNCVDWGQALAYCAFVNKRLPTEQEWEYAARGTDGRKYPWKDGPPAAQLCWNGDGNDLGKNNRQGTCAAGRFPAGASAFGALDMAGNVWEWTATTYCRSYDGKDCKEDRKVIRGGGWNNVKAEYVRAQDRSDEQLKARNDNVGFRCARGPSDKGPR